MDLGDFAKYCAGRKIDLGDYDYFFKFIVIGHAGVGKTSFVWQFSNNIFEDMRGIRIFNRMSCNRVTNIDDMPIVLRILDLPDANPPDRYERCTFYYGKSVGALILYDITRRETFNRLPRLVDEVRDVIPNIKIMIVGNKCDLESKRVVAKEEGELFAEQNGLLFMEASAATAENVEEAFNRCAAEVRKCYHIALRKKWFE